MTTESKQRVCSGHYGADQEGWPKATGVLIKHETLWRYARAAQSTGLPVAMSTDNAKLLFESARESGLMFNESAREWYRRAPMRFKAAGALVEAAICAAASDASRTQRVPGGMPHEVEEQNINGLLRGLIHNIRLAETA